MHITKKDWADLLKSLSIIIGHSLLEIHTRDFYADNGPWRTLDGDTRSKLITTIFTPDFRTQTVLTPDLALPGMISGH